MILRAFLSSISLVVEAVGNVAICKVGTASAFLESQRPGDVEAVAGVIA
jgi:hypothetical protein